jgi:hypothetical protein
MKNLKRQLRLTILSLSTLCLLTGAYGQITPSGDAYTNTAAPTTNYGAKTLLDVESSQTTYIQFNLSSIPSGYTSADLTKATLKLYVNAATTAGSFNVDYVNGTWSESTITANNAPALGTTIAASVPLIAADKNQYILVDITAAVQAWLSGTPNDGIALVGNSPLNASFDSKENTTTSHSAELDIVFAGGGTITGVTTASGSGLTGGGTSGTLNLALTNACAANQVLQWNGTSWVCASVGTGTITGVTAGTDLTGGGTSGNVTLNLDTTKTPLLVGNNSFTGNEIINGNLTVLNNSNYQPFLVQSSSTFGTWLELSNTSTGGQTWNILSAGGANAEGAGNLGITNLHGGTIWLEGPVNATGNVSVTGNVISTGTMTGGVVNASTSFNLGGNIFAFAPGMQNVFLGYSGNAMTSGISNAATGVGALSSDSSGSYNTASGTNALASNSTGSSNTAHGYFALFSNTSSNNTATGAQALESATTGTYNTADGYSALLSNGIGSNNTGSGAYALASINGGSYNTGIGFAAGFLANTLTVGSSNTFVGSFTNFGTSFVNNSTAIGAYALVTASNAMELGSINGVNGATADTSVGIGITAPTYKLHVGTINKGLRVEGPPTGGTGMVAASFGGNGDVGIDAPGTINGRFVVKDGGFIGVGNANPTRVLSVGQFKGNAIADGWDTYSSRRWKTNIQTLHGALDKVEQLRGVSYDLKETGKHEVGVIAEEVGAVVPEIVSWEKNGKDAQGVDYSRLTALLIEATKEQQRQIETQQTQIETQQTLMKAQQAQIALLASEMRTIQVSMKHGSNAGGAKLHTAQAQMARVHQ